MVSNVPAEHPDRGQTAEIAKRSRADLENALTALRDRIDQEFKRAERLDSKSRQAFAIAAGFFALTQAGAFATFGESAVSPDERTWLLVAAVATVLALAFTAIRVQHAESLREEEGIHIQSVFDCCVAEDEEGMVTAWLILAHREVAQDRKNSNDLRAEQVKFVIWAAGLTLTLCATELILALAVRM